MRLRISKRVTAAATAVLAASALGAVAVADTLNPDADILDGSPTTSGAEVARGETGTGRFWVQRQGACDATAATPVSVGLAKSSTTAGAADTLALSPAATLPGITACDAVNGQQVQYTAAGDAPLGATIKVTGTPSGGSPAVSGAVSFDVKIVPRPATALAASASSTTSVDVTWTKSADDAEITSYILTRNRMSSTDPSSTTVASSDTATLAPGTETHAHTVVAATRYCYSIVARYRPATTSYNSEAAGPICATTPASDETAPTTTASATVPDGGDGGTDPDPYTFDTWAAQNVTVALSATDNAGGSGVKEIRYTTDGTTPSASHGSVYDAASKPVISAEGATTVKFAAIDNAGNVEAAQSKIVKVDMTGPTGTTAAGTLDGGGAYTFGDWAIEDVTVAFSGSDDGSDRSGVKEVRFTTDGTTPSASHGSVYDAASKPVIGDEGTTTIKFAAIDNAGNVEDVQSETVKVDKSGPAGTLATGTLPGGGTYTFGDWTNQDVTVSFSGSADGADSSGVKEVRYTTDGSDPTATNGDVYDPSDKPVISASGETTVRFAAVDNAGNVEAVQSVIVRGDTVAPTGTTATGTLDGGGAYTFGDWTNEDVTVAFGGSDDGAGGSGVKEVRYTLDGSDPTASNGDVYDASDKPVISASGETTVKFAAIDNAGNVEDVQSVRVKVDKTAPTVNCAAADGDWHGNNVSIACTGEDGVSGLADGADASFALLTTVASGSEDASAATGSRTIYDRAGNSATAGPVGGNKVDRKKPSVSCGSADGDWHADNVSVTCTATDSGAGLGDPADASFPLTTTVADGEETANAATGTHLVVDAVGNSDTAGPVGGNKVDRKAPDVTCDAPSPTFELNASPAEVTGSFTDGGAGPASGTLTKAVSTSAVGTHSAELEKTDDVGNTGSATCDYDVVYDWTGFFRPVDATPTLNSVKAGSAVPVKFSLGGDRGLRIMAQETIGTTTVKWPKSQSIACDSGVNVDGIEEMATASTSGLTYDALAGQYVYVWKTEKSWAGTCRQLTVKLDDGTSHKANFKLTK